jgi:hypothetical protein
MSAIGPKRTSPSAMHMSAFGGKADIILCRNPLSLSLLSVKRIWLVAPHMSTFDPKRTFDAPFRALLCPGTMAGRAPRAQEPGDMRRREFLGVLTGAVVVSSRGAHAQRADDMRRIGIIVPANSTDMKFQIQVQAFEQELKKFGWMIGQNVQIETRWGTHNDNEIRKNAACRRCDRVSSGQCPLLAQSGHRLLRCTCPLSGGKADMRFCGASTAGT